MRDARLVRTVAWCAVILSIRWRWWWCSYVCVGKTKEGDRNWLDVCWNRAFQREEVLGAETVKTQFFFFSKSFEAVVY